VSGDGELRTELVVVGAGPGGLEAARVAARYGVEVVLLDASARPGGQYHRQANDALDPDRPGALHHGWRAATRRFEEIAASPRVRHLAATHVWSAAAPSDGPVVLETVGAHRGRIAARAVVLATGSVERVLPFPGWTLPGVVTVGAAQALLKSQGIAVGRRVVVAGAGPLSLPVAAALVRSGTQVVEVAERSGPASWRAGGRALLRPDKAVEAAGYLGVLARAGVPVRPLTAVVRAAGTDAVTSVTLARVDGAGRAIPGTERDLEVDALCVSDGFAPSVELGVALGCRLTDEVVPAVRVDALQSTSDPRVLAVGEVTGIAGADAAVAEGRVAGLAVARRLGASPDPAAFRRAARRRDVAVAFGGGLQRATAPGPGWIEALDDDTVVCRCEEVPYARVRRAIASGVGDPRSVKLTTRCGMGYCQGRLCAPIVGALLQASTGSVPPEPGALAARPVATPVRLGEL
jgi:NADPH-dependent 2,4-dienoyl-CoA reductase/sulfur reductase-like enzyme